MGARHRDRRRSKQRPRGRHAIARTAPGCGADGDELRDGDGLEATQAIRQECPETQVLILTSYGSPELLRRASAAGAAGYFLKDVDPDNLVTAIRAVRHGRPWSARRWRSTS